jgi:hypothetical protein
MPDASIVPCMSFGRLIRVGNRRDENNVAIYVVAEYDAQKAIRIVQRKLGDTTTETEDLGRVSEGLLTALGLKSGEIAKT